MMKFWALRGILKNNSAVKRSKGKNLSQIIKEESGAFGKIVAENVVKEMGLEKDK